MIGHVSGHVNGNVLGNGLDTGLDNGLGRKVEGLGYSIKRRRLGNVLVTEMGSILSFVDVSTTLEKGVKKGVKKTRRLRGL